MKKGKIHSYTTLSAIDGPGLRFVLFLQGCPLRCLYCHNPDTWIYENGKEYGAEEILAIVEQYRSFIGKGGVTVSGGEPLLQKEFLTEFVRLCKLSGIHTAVDTAGSIELSDSLDLLRYTDLFILDIKQSDPEKYRQLTSGDLYQTLRGAKLFSDMGKKMWIRYVLVPGYTDDRKDLEHYVELVRELKGVERVIVLPYATLGVDKWRKLHYEYLLEGVAPPSGEEVEQVKTIFREGGLPV